MAEVVYSNERFGCRLLFINEPRKRFLMNNYFVVVYRWYCQLHFEAITDYFHHCIQPVCSV